MYNATMQRSQNTMRADILAELNFEQLKAKLTYCLLFVFLL